MFDSDTFISDYITHRKRKTVLLIFIIFGYRKKQNCWIKSAKFKRIALLNQQNIYVCRKYL